MFKFRRLVGRCKKHAVNKLMVNSQETRQRQTHRQTDKQTNRQTDKQTNRQADKQKKNRQTDRQQYDCKIGITRAKLDL